MSNFIITEDFQGYGVTGEQLVWQKVILAFQPRECIGYWRYPIFDQLGKGRKEPDILILDQEIGIVIIEVKSIYLNQIRSIQGHCWQIQNFYQSKIYPYQQAEQQLYSLLAYFKNEPSLSNKITAKVMVALPYVSQTDWQQSNFAKLPSIPPILLKEDLDNGLSLLEKIKQISPLRKSGNLTPKKWQLLQSLITGSPVYCQENHRVLSHSQSRGKVLQKLRSHLTQGDLKLDQIAKYIPNGCQRIRGIAGSGKTVILCQKAAIMHLKNPDWKIALIFFSRSLYQTIQQQINRWLNYYSNGQISYQSDNKNLLIFHAWGSKEQQGFYHYLCKITKSYALNVNQTDRQSPSESLGEACVDLLNKKALPQVFDAILIDEAQDFMVNRWQWQGKQPFFWLAYQSLKVCNQLDGTQKRLIWAYDELQALETLKIPTASQLLGEELGHLVTGTYSENIPKTCILNHCYRTPPQILMAAYGLGMGLLRPNMIITGINQSEEWKALGFKVQGKLIKGQKITLSRLDKDASHPLLQWWKGKLIEFKTYETRQQELSALSDKIKTNLRQDGLRPSQDILVIILGDYFNSLQLQTYTAKYLTRQGIDIYIPSADNCNQLPQRSVKINQSQFWYQGAVTLSRIYRCKGNEAAMVYLIGLDHIAQSEADILLRNQLFIALTRSQAWINISGVGNYSFYQEVKQVLNSLDEFTFTYSPSFKREISSQTLNEILHRYAVGERNFQGINLQSANLARIKLSQANLIKANLSHANLQNADLSHSKLIAADLSYANLSDANLRNAKLIGANLTGTIFKNTDLSYADITDTLLEK
ncbi:MAG: pentapeptide repeat-containing protein [Microcystaceae cyanobacterium]